jgi:hypothetical protein
MNDTERLAELMGWYQRDGEWWQPKSFDMSEDLNVTNVMSAILALLDAARKEARINELNHILFTDDPIMFSKWLLERKDRLTQKQEN